MDALLDPVVWMFVLAFVLCGLMLVRNQRVYQYRGGLLEKISKVADRDIQYRRDWLWRYQVYDLVSYDEMLIKFWRPLESFYDLDYLLGEQQCHASDCAVHNEPAMPNGPCDCRQG